MQAQATRFTELANASAELDENIVVSIADETLRFIEFDKTCPVPASEARILSKTVNPSGSDPETGQLYRKRKTICPAPPHFPLSRTGAKSRSFSASA